MNQKIEREEQGPEGFEYDCEAPRQGAYSVEEMNEMAPPEVRAMFEARQKALAARQAQGENEDAQ